MDTSREIRKSPATMPHAVRPGGIDPQKSPSMFENVRRLPELAREDLFALTIDELERQSEKWGERNYTPAEWFLILSDEFGEVARAALTGDLENLEHECAQVCAVMIRFLEASRDGNESKPMRLA